jgi:hypothetical protein
LVIAVLAWAACTSEQPAGVGPDAGSETDSRVVDADPARSCPAAQEPDWREGELVTYPAQQLTPTGDVWADFFGGAVAIHGDVVVVGAANDDGYSDTDPKGGVYILERDPATDGYETSAYFTHEGAFGFGRSLATDGEIVAVGAPGTWSTHLGGIHIYEKGAEGWQRTALLRTRLQEGLGFAGDLAVYKGTVFATARGAVSMFRRDDEGNWQESAAVSKPVGAKNTFGHAIAVDADTLVVSDLHLDQGDRSYAGGVFVFRRVAGRWEQHQLIRPARDYYITEFGTDVALDGDVLVVSSAYHSQVFIYERDASGYFCLQARFYKPGRHTFNTDLGRSVAVHDGVVVAGRATNVSPNTGTHGHVYVYQKSSAGNWVELELASPSLDDTDNMGISVGIWGKRVIAGDNYDDTACPRDTSGGCNAGSAYIFSLP